VKLSIVIPTLNEAAGIAATLAALQPLRRRGVEAIVADGGSDDATVALARPLVDRLCIVAPGRARQMNAGAALAAGDVLLFLHADTLLPEHADSETLHALQQHDRVWGRFDVRIAGGPRLLPLVAMLMNLRSRLTGIATGDQAMFVRRATFLAAGGFPELPLMEDIALSARLKCVSRPACLRASVTTSGRRWERHGFWRTVVLMWWLRLRFFFGTPPARLALHYRNSPR
jgi:rSAM/selenodomain-associated transferase 2